MNSDSPRRHSEEIMVAQPDSNPRLTRGPHPKGPPEIGNLVDATAHARAPTLTSSATTQSPHSQIALAPVMAQGAAGGLFDDETHVSSDIDLFELSKVPYILEKYRQVSRTVRFA